MYIYIYVRVCRCVRMCVQIPKHTFVHTYTHDFQIHSTRATLHKMSLNTHTHGTYTREIHPHTYTHTYSRASMKRMGGQH